MSQIEIIGLNAAVGNAAFVVFLGLLFHAIAAWLSARGMKP
jgi:hypothetical protein